MRAIRPPSNMKVTAMFASPAGSIQTATVPSSSGVAISAPGANCGKRHRNAATRWLPFDRVPGRGRQRTAVRDQHHIGREHVQQTLQVTGGEGSQESMHHPLLLPAAHCHPRTPRSHMSAPG